MYGSPTVFTFGNHLGVIISCLLERPYKTHKTEVVNQFRVFDKFSAQLEIFIPRVWLQEYKVGWELSNNSIISFNKLFEEKFEEDLFKHCHLASIYNIELKKAMEDFCLRHKIQIGEQSDDHITFDALKKKEYRRRVEAVGRRTPDVKIFSKKAAPFVPLNL